MKKLFFYILITLVTTNAFANEKLNKVLDELKQIKTFLDMDLLSIKVPF